MIVRFHKTSHQDYELECVRPDGSSTRALFEAKSCLPHDLLHFVIESRAGLRNSFFGSMAQGMNIETLAMDNMQQTGPGMKSEAEVTEMVAGAMNAVARGGAVLAQFMQIFTNVMMAHGLPMPVYLSEEFVAAAAGEWKRLMAQYDALKTGQTLEVQFPDI